MIYRLDANKTPVESTYNPEVYPNSHKCIELLGKAFVYIPKSSYCQVAPIHGVKIPKIGLDTVPLPCYVETDDELSLSDLTFGHLFKML